MIMDENVLWIKMYYACCTVLYVFYFQYANDSF